MLKRNSFRPFIVALGAVAAFGAVVAFAIGPSGRIKLDDALHSGGSVLAGGGAPDAGNGVTPGNGGPLRTGGQALKQLAAELTADINSLAAELYAAKSDVRIHEPTSTAGCDGANSTAINQAITYVNAAAAGIVSMPPGANGCNYYVVGASRRTNSDDASHGGGSMVSGVNTLKVTSGVSSGSGGPLQTGAPVLKQQAAAGNSMSRELSAAQTEVSINEPAYGAVCDGATDDSAAINQAITDINAAGGGTVWIPPSANGCAIGSYIAMKSNVWLYGVPGQSKIVANAGITNSPQNGGVLTFAGVTDAGMDGVSLDMNEASVPGLYGIVVAPAVVTAQAERLAFSTHTANFTVGRVLQGSASGATAQILCFIVGRTCVEPDPGSGSGQMVLTNIVGTFQSAESLTEVPSGGAAVASTAVLNPNSHRISIRNCSVTGKAFTDQKLIYIKQATDVDVTSCRVEGNSIRETTSQYYYGNSGGTGVDQEGITVVGGRHVRVVGNNVRNIASTALYPYVDSRTISQTDNFDIVIDNNDVDGGAGCVQIESGYSTAYGLKITESLQFTNNRCIGQWALGIAVLIDRTNLITTFGTVVGRGIVIANNVVDMRMSPRDAHHAQTGLYGSYAGAIYNDSDSTVDGVPPNTVSGGTTLCSGCIIADNTFLGGGGADAAPASYVNGMQGWDIIGNTWADVALSAATPYALEIGSFSHGLSFRDNKFINIARSCIRLTNSYEVEMTGNQFMNWDAAGDLGYAAIWLESAHGLVLVGNTYNPRDHGLTGVNGDATTRSVTQRDNRVAGITSLGINLWRDVMAGAWADESATNTSIINTSHAHGKVSWSAVGSTSFTVTSPMITDHSRILLRKTGDGVNHPYVETVVVNALTGAMRFTTASAAIGATTLTLNNVAGFVNGAVIRTSNTNGTNSRLHQVGAPSGSVISLDRPLLAAVSSVATVAYSYGSFTVTLSAATASGDAFEWDVVN